MKNYKKQEPFAVKKILAKFNSQNREIQKITN
jgi:hypothetical protein